MHRLLVLSILCWVSEAGLVRVPKIYNALITSDENLSPSQAFPILEPVLRTTALGVAFPPIVVRPPIPNPESTNKETDNRVKEETTTDSIELSEELAKKKPSQEQKQQQVPQLSYHGSLYPLAYDPYVPYGYHQEFFYPTLPFHQHPVYIDVGQYNNENKQKTEKATPAHVNRPVANLKTNPDIPDVIPPLPTKIDQKRNL